MAKQWGDLRRLTQWHHTTVSPEHKTYKVLHNKKPGRIWSYLPDSVISYSICACWPNLGAQNKGLQPKNYCPEIKLLQVIVNSTPGKRPCSVKPGWKTTLVLNRFQLNLYMETPSWAWSWNPGQYTEFITQNSAINILNSIKGSCFNLWSICLIKVYNFQSLPKN